MLILVFKQIQLYLCVSGWVGGMSGNMTNANVSRKMKGKNLLLPQLVSVTVPVIMSAFCHTESNYSALYLKTDMHFSNRMVFKCKPSTSSASDVYPKEAETHIQFFKLISYGIKPQEHTNYSWQFETVARNTLAFQEPTVSVACDHVFLRKNSQMQINLCSQLEMNLSQNLKFIMCE